MKAMPRAVAAWTSPDDDRRAVDEDVARVRLLDAPDDLHQGRLAGAVLAEQRDHLAGVHVEADASQRVHARKPLVDVPKLKNRRAHDVTDSATRVSGRAAPRASS